MGRKGGKEKEAERDKERKETWWKEVTRWREECQATTCTMHFIISLPVFIFFSSRAPLVTSLLICPLKIIHGKGSVQVQNPVCVCLCVRMRVCVWLYWIRGLLVSKNLLDTQNIQSSVCGGCYYCINTHTVLLRKRRYGVNSVEFTAHKWLQRMPRHLGTGSFFLFFFFCHRPCCWRMKNQQMKRKHELCEEDNEEVCSWIKVVLRFPREHNRVDVQK